MDARTLTALKASIKHWEENVAAETPDEASTRAIDCALCNEFDWDACVGCPVMERAGVRLCRRTPYPRAFDAHAVWQWNPNSESHKLVWRKAAQAELDFLKSLLPAKEAAE
jgi:hypothetical protein